MGSSFAVQTFRCVCRVALFTHVFSCALEPEERGVDARIDEGALALTYERTMAAGKVTFLARSSDGDDAHSSRLFVESDAGAFWVAFDVDRGLGALRTSQTPFLREHRVALEEVGRSIVDDLELAQPSGQTLPGTLLDALRAAPDDYVFEDRRDVVMREFVNPEAEDFVGYSNGDDGTTCVGPARTSAFTATYWGYYDNANGPTNTQLATSSSNVCYGQCGSTTRGRWATGGSTASSTTTAVTSRFP